MAVHCPSCGSQFVVAKHLAKTVGGTAGLIGGGTLGVMGAVGGARQCAAFGAFAGPVGIGVGSFSGAVIGGLLGASSGGLAGAEIGEHIDKKVLKNYECNHCHHQFAESDLVMSEGN